MLSRGYASRSGSENGSDSGRRVEALELWNGGEQGPRPTDPDLRRTVFCRTEELQADCLQLSLMLQLQARSLQLLISEELQSACLQLLE